MSGMTYWKRIDGEAPPPGQTITYEHQEPHGRLVRTVTVHPSGIASDVVFVTSPPKPGIAAGRIVAILCNALRSTMHDRDDLMTALVLELERTGVKFPTDATDVLAELEKLEGL